MGIEVRHVTKTFGKFRSLDDVSFSVASGELVALLGPSGSGKTTLLRIIAGLEFADSGTVLLEDEDATDRNARDRGVGFVFQHYALFRHLTVFENVAFGLRVRPRATRPARDAIRARVMELLKEKGLDDVLVVVGGIIPDVDIPKLQAMGVKGIFLPGSPMQHIVDFITTNVRSRVGQV